MDKSQKIAAATHFIESNVGPLPKVLDYVGEYGPELVLFTPFCNWLSKFGILKDRKIRIYRGMRCFYDDLECMEIVEKNDKRTFVRPTERAAWLPVKNEHDFDSKAQTPFHIYPDLRAKFLNIPLTPSIGTLLRPILVIHNKHNNEWDEGPVNHIGLEALDFLFMNLTRAFTVVYIRHGITPKNDNFSDDHNVTLSFNERDVLNRHPDVICFDDLYEAHRTQGGTQDLNTFKCVIYSRCHHFISSQGGGAHQIALFSGSLLVVLHRKGSEESWAYGDGYYGFMSNIPPIRAICRTENDLRIAAELFKNTKVVGGRLLVDSAKAILLQSFSPWTINQRKAPGR